MNNDNQRSKLNTEEESWWNSHLIWFLREHHLHYIYQFALLSNSPTQHIFYLLVRDLFWKGETCCFRAARTQVSHRIERDARGAEKGASISAYGHHVQLIGGRICLGKKREKNHFCFHCCYARKQKITGAEIRDFLLKYGVHLNRKMHKNECRYVYVHTHTISVHVINVLLQQHSAVPQFILHLLTPQLVNNKCFS